MKQQQRQGTRQTQAQRQKLGKTQQQFLAANPSEIATLTRDALAENPELELAGEWEDNPNGGERDDLAASLEQAALELAESEAPALCRHFRETGRLPDDAPHAVREALARLRRERSRRPPALPAPTFHVTVQGGHVLACILPSLADQVRGPASGFLDLREKRRQLLTELARGLLETVQADFFRSPDLHSALLMLLPFGKEQLGQLVPTGEFRDDDLSRLGWGLSVSCRFGLFPLALFFQPEAKVRRLLADEAARHGHGDNKTQAEWVCQRSNARLAREFVPPTSTALQVRRQSLERLSKTTTTQVRDSRKGTSSGAT